MKMEISTRIDLRNKSFLYKVPNLKNDSSNADNHTKGYNKISHPKAPSEKISQSRCRE